MASNSVLQTTSLAVGYRHDGIASILFDNITLTLPTGQLTCFMGPNGIGKSTLIRTIAGLQPPIAGHMTRLDEKNMALVLTDKISSPNMTVFELVSYGRYPHLGWGLALSPHDSDVVNQSIAEVAIEFLAKKKLDELSDGQMQLAMIARALAQETPILLLDEPTAHLDLNNRVEIMKLLHRLAHQKQKAILVTTHELDLALQLADLIWLATPDKKIKTGIPEDLVLDGSFDAIFQFKGFDLRTGKIQHEVTGKTIHLIGTDFPFLWTKNALEREGFAVGPSGASTIVVEGDGAGLRWTMDGAVFNTLAAVLARLRQG